jgi:hypothetical protein
MDCPEKIDSTANEEADFLKKDIKKAESLPEASRLR